MTSAKRESLGSPWKLTRSSDGGRPWKRIDRENDISTVLFLCPRCHFYLVFLIYLLFICACSKPSIILQHLPSLPPCPWSQDIFPLQLLAVLKALHKVVLNKHHQPALASNGFLPRCWQSLATQATSWHPLGYT